jgi:hypothetical protein
VPLLFHRTDRSGPWIGLDENSGALRLDVDFVASTFFMLSRWEEITDPARDDHGRFPAQKSWAFRAGFLDRPVIDEYALILRAWLEVAQPRLPATTNRFQVEISHDVDHIGRFPTKASLLRQLRSGLAQRGTSTLRTWRDFRVERKEPGVSAEIERTRWLATVSSQNGLASIFNFMAARPSHYDPGYDVEAPHVRSLMQELSNLGCEIGFHPSYKTFSDPRLMAEEKATLDRAAPQPARGGRQHFLRFEAPTTWRAWSDLGLNYDSTVGYADHEGFRCGTCHPFNAFDTEQNEVLPIEERPLLVMDGTLLDYRGLSVDEGYARVLALASKARDVGGIFTLLWHNTSLDGRWSEWGRRYPALVEALAAL